MDFPGGASGKEPVCQYRRHRGAGLIPGSWRSPGRGHGNPLQYSCLENPMDRGAWWAIVHRLAVRHNWSNWTHARTRTHTHTHTHGRQRSTNCSLVFRLTGNAHSIRTKNTRPKYKGKYKDICLYELHTGGPPSAHENVCANWDHAVWSQ